MRRNQQGFIAVPSADEAIIIGKIVLVVLFAAACVGGGWYVKGRFDEGEIARLTAERDAAVTQGKVLVGSLAACNEGAETTRKASLGVLQMAQDTLKQLAPLLAQNRKTVSNIEDLLKKPTPVGAGCKDAWSALDALRKAGTK